MVERTSSRFLSEAENEILLKLLGQRRQNQATAVAQILVARPPDFGIWEKIHVGVATFTKDNIRRSYFIQV